VSLKGLFSLGLMVLMGLVLIFSACTKKTIVNPPPTPETASCFTCHSDSNNQIMAPKGQWEKSVHASGAHIFENSSGCSFCHTNEGFISLILTGTTIEVENPTAIGCFTCHAPHTSGNLTLRTNASYMLLDSTSSSTYDKGQSNICANCHHSRRNVHTYVYDGVRMSSHYGPHHSPQADMLLGTNAYEYSGVTYDDNSYHSYGVTDGCITCHMETVVGYTLGGHSMNMDWEGEENVESCNSTTCHHGTITEFNRPAAEDYDNDGNIEGVQDEIEGLVEQLKSKLIAANLLTTGGDPVARVVATKDSVGAVYNYEFIQGDRSKGIHNTKYAVKLLQSSLAFLEAGGGKVSAWK
jgi:hypothetical protein